MYIFAASQFLPISPKFKYFLPFGKIKQNFYFPFVCNVSGIFAVCVALPVCR